MNAAQIHRLIHISLLKTKGFGGSLMVDQGQPIPLTFWGMDDRKGSSKSPQIGEKDESPLGAVAHDLYRRRSEAGVPVLLHI